MRYISTVFSTFICALLIYFGVLVALTPLLIPAEYWVRETMTVKRSIAAQHRGQPKIIIGSGSSGLFAVDTTQLTMELGRPVINLALHGGLALETILTETGAPAEPGDALILLLEPVYYSRKDPSTWQIRNMIAWEPDAWQSLSVPTRIVYLAQLEPSFFLEVLAARFQPAVNPAVLSARLAAFDDAAILARFAAAKPPMSFEYSAYNLDSLGNIQQAIGNLGVKSGAVAADTLTEIGPAQRAMLISFVHAMGAKGVAVFFAHAPLVAPHHADRAAIDRASAAFVLAMSDIGPVIDDRSQVVFDERFFFNTELHLNIEGRRLRTAALLAAIRRYVIKPTPL